MRRRAYQWCSTDETKGVPVRQGIQDSNPKVANKEESSKTPSLLYFSKSVSARPIGYHLIGVRKQFPHCKPMLLCKLSRSSYQTWKVTRFLWSNVMAGANVHWSGLQLMQRVSLMHPKPEVSTWPIPQHEIVKKLVHSIGGSSPSPTTGVIIGKSQWSPIPFPKAPSNSKLD